MRKKIPLGKDRFLNATYQLAASFSRRWIVYIPESGPDFYDNPRTELKNLLGRSFIAGFNLLILNKAGVGPSEVDYEMFEASFRRRTRVQDCLRALNSIVPRGDEIILVGYSEGAYLAPEIANRDRRVKKFVMIGGGTRGWLKEEARNCERFLRKPSEKRELKRQLRRVYRNPKSKEVWNGFSFATWYSYREDRTLKSLKKIKVPALVLLGARDRNIDYETTLSDLSRLARKKPISVRVFKNCGHSFVSHWPAAAKEIRAFLRGMSGV